MLYHPLGQFRGGGDVGEQFGLEERKVLVPRSLEMEDNEQ